MTGLQVNFDPYIASYPDFPKPGILFRDISPLLASPEGMAQAVDVFESRLQDFKVDVVAGIESRGFLFSTLIAARLGIGSLMIRKPGKLPGELINARYDLEYGSAELNLQTCALVAGRKVLILDDLLATGGTIAAAKALLLRQKADVVGCAVIIELLALGGRSVVDLPVVALQAYED